MFSFKQVLLNKIATRVLANFFSKFLIFRRSFLESVNAVSGQQKLNKIIGEYEPGYIYGNVKTHKAEYPLRPIISQIKTPTYKLAKKLNDLIRLYIPSDYLLKSTHDFIDL